MGFLWASGRWLHLICESMTIFQSITASKMAKRDIIVVGASAGGITALSEMLRSIPRNFKATIFVVLHLPPASPSALPAILTRAGVLKAYHAVDDELIKPGVIYVAPPDHHILLEGDRVLVKKG